MVTYAAVLALSGAVHAQSDDAPDTCGAAGLQGLVGQSGEIARMLVMEGPVRVIEPGSAVTRDYRLNRINFDLDEDGIIIAINCG